jgi:hypothetical protein
LDLHGEDGAGLNGAAVQVHDTGAALRCVAADMRAGQAKFFPQKFSEQHIGLRFGPYRLAIHFERNFRHRCFPPKFICCGVLLYVRLPDGIPAGETMPRIGGKGKAMLKWDLRKFWVEGRAGGLSGAS